MCLSNRMPPVPSPEPGGFVWVGHACNKDLKNKQKQTNKQKTSVLQLFFLYHNLNGIHSSEAVFLALTCNTVSQGLILKHQKFVQFWFWKTAQPINKYVLVVSVSPYASYWAVSNIQPQYDVTVIHWSNYLLSQAWWLHSCFSPKYVPTFPFIMSTFSVVCNHCKPIHKYNSLIAVVQKDCPCHSVLFVLKRIQIS